MIAFECINCSFFYPDGTRGIEDLTLKISGGSKVAVIGPNGAGKSTLLGLFNGILQAKGRISVYGREMNRKNLAAIRRQIGLVFQNPDDQLFCPTIFEDVAFGPQNLGLDDEVVHELVNSVLNEVGLTGYGPRSSLHLSFGEKKLAAIAAVLAMQPRLLAMDEPTSNLDARHRRKIIDWIQLSDKTFVITSHDLDMILETCQRVVLLNNGKIVADGPAEQILYNQSLLEENDLELPLSCRAGTRPIQK